MSLFPFDGSLTKKTSHAGGDYEVYTWNHRGKMKTAKAYSSSGTLLWTEEYRYDAAGRNVHTIHETFAVPIENNSFEKPVLADGAYTYSIDGWTGTGWHGTYNPLAFQFSGPTATHGSQTTWINSGSISQELSTQVLPHQTYRLSVDVGNRLDVGAASYLIELLAGNTVLESVTQADYPVVVGGFVTAQLEYQSGAVPPSGALQVRITLTGGSQINVDNVRFVMPTNKYSIYDGFDMYSLLMELDGNERITMNAMHSPAVDMVLAEDRLIYDSSGNVTDHDIQWPLGDHQNSAIAVATTPAGTNNPPTVTDTAIRSAFGEVIAGAAPNSSFQYQGQVSDSRTGQSEFRNRNFPTQQGRFISQDPIRFASGQTNHYQFVRNHPHMGTDPSGLQEPDENPYFFMLRDGRSNSSTAASLRRGWSEVANDPSFSESHRRRAAIALGQIAEMESILRGRESPVPGVIADLPSIYMGALSGEARTDMIDEVLYRGGQGFRSVGVLAGGAAAAIPTGGASLTAGGYLVIGYEIDQAQSGVRSIWSGEHVSSLGASTIQTAFGDDTAIGMTGSLAYDFAGLAGIMTKAPVKGLASTADGPAMDPGRFARMKAAFERNPKRSIDTSPQAQMDMFEMGGPGQTGLTLSADDVLMRPNPSASTFFDEMIHTSQFRHGRVDRAYSLYGRQVGIDVLEFEVQRKLLKNATAYGITDVERAAIKVRALEIYRRLQGSGNGTVREMLDAIQ